MAIKRTRQVGEPASSDVPRSRKRSGERVLEYLRAEFDRPDMREGSRLPTIQQISAHLNVSVPTVHSVFKRLANEGRIRSRAGQGSFLISHRAAHMTYNVALTIDVSKNAPAAPFISRLCGNMLRVASECDPPLVLVPLKHLEGAAVRTELIQKLPTVDALVLFPQPSMTEIREAYEEAGKPVVHFNPPHEMATVNFVSFDYFGESVRLGRALKRSGRRRVALILGTLLSGTVSGQLRRFGLETGLEMGFGEDIQLRIVEAQTYLVEEGAQAMEELLRTKFAPDAVFCMSDYLALGALRVLRRHGLRVPEDVSLVGGTGLDLSETACPMLTRVRQPLEEMGEAMARMLSFRLRNRCAPVPGKVLPTRFIGGATTLPAENGELGIQLSN